MWRASAADVVVEERFSWIGQNGFVHEGGAREASLPVGVFDVSR
jgi:hypothetical protein